MTALVLGLTLLMLLLPEISNSKGFFKKAISQEWVQDTWLKYGQLGSLCVAQGFNGLVESKKYGGHHIVSDSDYHVYRYAQNISMLSAGYFLSANIRSKKLPWTTKVRRIIGSTLIARNSFEFLYRANVTGDPFFYGDIGTNRKALVYFRFSFSEFRFIDMYISGIGRRGVFIDLACGILGWWIYD